MVLILSVQPRKRIRILLKAAVPWALLLPPRLRQSAHVGISGYLMCSVKNDGGGSDDGFGKTLRARNGFEGASLNADAR